MVDSKPLKVLHICQRDDPATGGAVRVAVEYVKRLPNYNIDAHCLFLYGPPGTFQKELGDRAHYLDLRDSQDVIKFNRFLQFVRIFRPQIIHHHDHLLWPQLLTLYHPDIVKVVHAHITATAKSLTRFKASIAAWLQQQSTDYLLAVTEDTRQSYICHYSYAPERTYVIYNGVDFKQFYPATLEQQINARRQLGLPLDKPVIGFVGRLHCHTKGTDDFLKLLHFLPSNIWGLVVGDGPDAVILKTLAQNLKISDRLIFTGFLDRPALAYYAMTIFCLTSNYESFGLVVAEAMACGLPVVGFACEGGVKELLTLETGWVIPNRDIKMMAKTITELIDSEQALQKKRETALKIVTKHHNWETNAEILATHYRDWIANRNILKS
ncbi:glycosyltransferase family 4 protein [Trichothermofontia sichuanensis B231]|uniref:glycosyltransferase family 4 protein n=1 Tax=Trichothermofontia sichuanensis TaxID=3045816 RepID=UPI0022455D93|nr:glycosyltransferase family 4 protein [Trichothermofontia sichuanensis]UZQ55313.1 glycosyltransferase family 4 protein [Trichothermofontia sichuanensis B231]